MSLKSVQVCDKHLGAAEYQLIFFPATICEGVITLFSYSKWWIFDIFPIALVSSNRCRLFRLGDATNIDHIAKAKSELLFSSKQMHFQGV